jgi:hypothetical protein
MRYFVVVGLFVFLLAGCGSGPRRIHVVGEASYDGRPIDEGEIVFFPVDGTPGPSTGGVIRAGQYDVAAEVGPYAGGTYRVELTGVRKGGRYIPGANGGGPTVEVVDQYIPATYNHQSTVQVTFPAESNDARNDFHLERPEETGS